MILPEHFAGLGVVDDRGFSPDIRHFAAELVDAEARGLELLELARTNLCASARELIPASASGRCRIRFLLGGGFGRGGARRRLLRGRRSGGGLRGERRRPS